MRRLRELGSRLDGAGAGAIFLLVAAATLLTRAPLLGPGFGADPDAWRVGLAAREIARTHAYAASRLPGAPLQELASALLIGGGAPALNAATALMSALAAGGFAAALRRLGMRGGGAALAGLALTLTPVVYINSVVAMDYLWALGFLMVALAGALSGRAAVAGACAGLAIGCRITSGAMLAPLSLLLLRTERPWRTITIMWAAALGVGLPWYAPGALRYGAGLFRLAEHGYPPAAFVLKVGLADVWGPVGLAALGLAAGLGILERRRGETAPALEDAGGRRITSAAGLGVALYLALFLKMPHEAGYLVPLIPCALLLAARLLPRRAFGALCLGLCLAPFVVGLGFMELPGFETAPRGAVVLKLAGHPLYIDALRGPVWQEARARGRKMETARRIVEAGGRLPPKSAVIVGSHLPMVEWLRPAAAAGGTRYEDLLPRAAVERLAREGYALYDTPFQREREWSVYGVDLRGMGSRGLLAGAIAD